MRLRGFKGFASSFAIVAAAMIFCQATYGQRAFTVLPPSSTEGGDPIAFVRPHYILHTRASGDNLAAPPTTALVPAKIRHAYGFDQIANQGAGQVIGIVDAYDDAKAEADLGVFSKEFGLVACTTANGCFHKVFQTASSPRQMPTGLLKFRLISSGPMRLLPRRRLSWSKPRPIT